MSTKAVRFLLCFTCIYVLSQAKPIISQPQPFTSFKINNTIQVYAPRLDDPWSSTFERCSADTFRVKGPCTHQICYVYLYRTCRDGWKPDNVKIFGYYSKPVTFYFKAFLPGGIWYGFNYCSSASS